MPPAVAFRSVSGHNGEQRLMVIINKNNDRVELRPDRSMK